MMRIIIFFLFPIVLSFPSNNFLSPGREEKYLAAGFYRAEKADTGVESANDLGGGFWPSAKFLMLRRRNKGKVTDAPSKNNDDVDEKDIRTTSWDIIEGTTTVVLPQTTTVISTTTVEVPTITPLPPSPTIDQVALRAKLLKGTPPKFLEDGSDDAKFSFATIGMGEKLTKAQLRQAYTEWTEKQDPKIKEAFYRQREEHDLRVNGMRMKMVEKSKNRLSSEARGLFDKIQTIHDNENLTIDENIGLVQEVMNGADESVRKELREMKK